MVARQGTLNSTSTSCANHQMQRAWCSTKFNIKVPFPNMKQPLNFSFLILIIFTSLTTTPGFVIAQNISVDIPENAQAKNFGSGWECDPGYRAANNSCVAIKVPENAYSTNTTYGRGWKCSWGYLRADDTCIVIEIPANAYLNSHGDRWECDRGYRAEREGCIMVKIPTNGYLLHTSYGPGWKCNRGYRAIRERCVALNVPKFAHIDFSGDDWECNRPYRKQQDRCELPRGRIK